MGATIERACRSYWPLPFWYDHPAQPMMPKIELFYGDITTLAVDAIVNAANPSLIPGGEAIFSSVSESYAPPRRCASLARRQRQA